MAGKYSEESSSKRNENINKISKKSKKTSAASRSGLVFPVGRIQTTLKHGKYSEHIGKGAAIYLAAVIEYLCAEILELASNATKDNKKFCILPRHLQLAIKNDEEINKLFSGVTIAEGGVVPSMHATLKWMDLELNG